MKGGHMVKSKKSTKSLHPNGGTLVHKVIPSTVQVILLCVCMYLYKIYILTYYTTGIGFSIPVAYTFRGFCTTRYSDNNAHTTQSLVHLSVDLTRY